MKDCGQGNIANILQMQNKLPGALVMFYEVLVIFEKVHGCEHPDVANTKEKYSCAFDGLFLAQQFHAIVICSIGLALYEQNKNSAALVRYPEVLRV